MAAPTTWSYSQVSKLFECGEAYRLEKVAKAPRTPAWWFVSGNAFHKASEVYDRRLFKGEELSEEELVAEWETIWGEEVERCREDEPDETKWFRGGRPTKAAPNREDGEFLHAQGRIWIANYRTWRQENAHLQPLDLPDGEPAIEVRYSVQIAGQTVNGGIDRVFIDTRTGEPLIVDHKTGSRKPENDDQLCEYGHALKQLFGIEVAYGAYYMAREARLKDPQPLTMSLARFENNIRVATVLRDNKAYAARVSSRCKTCPVNRFCAAYGGPDAYLYEGIDE